MQSTRIYQFRCRYRSDVDRLMLYVPEPDTAAVKRTEFDLFCIEFQLKCIDEQNEREKRSLSWFDDD